MKKGTRTVFFWGILTGDEILSRHRDSFITHEIRIPSLTNQSDSWNVGVVFFDGTGQSWMGFREEGPCHPSCECGGEHPVQRNADDAIGTFGNKNWIDITEQQLTKDNKKHQKNTKAIYL